METKLEQNEIDEYCEVDLNSEETIRAPSDQETLDVLNNKTYDTRQTRRYSLV